MGEVGGYPIRQMILLSTVMVKMLSAEQMLLPG